MAQGDVTILSEDVFGTLNVVVGSVELSDDSYEAGGVPLSEPMFGLAAVYFVDCQPVELTSTAALIARYNYTGDAIQLYEGDGPTTAGPLAEIGDSDDLSSSGDVFFVAYGRK